MKRRPFFPLVVLCLMLFFTAAAFAAEDDTDYNNGQDITRPLTRFDMRYEYQNAPLLPSGHDDMHVVTLRVDKPIPLSPQWVLATRFDVPLMFTDKMSEDNMRGHTRFGLSDVLGQVLVANLTTERFAWALGAQMVFPTGTEDEMGTGTYRVVPTFGARWKTDEALKGSWVALAARWDKSFADSRDNVARVNELQFAPLVNIPLPNYWFVNLFPSTDIRYNLGDKREGDSGRWFVPANFMLGKMLSKDLLTSVEVGVPVIDDYHVYDFKVEARVGFFF